MKKTLLTVLCLMTLPLNAMAQMIQLTSKESKNQLWLDPDRFYDYNLYEKSRWGLGVQYDINFSDRNSTIAKEKPSGGFKRLSLSAYGAYGYQDQRFKWGLKADLQGASKSQTHNYLAFIHDLTPAASRTLSTPTLNLLSLPSSFMTSLFSDTYRLTLGHSRKKNKTIESFELRLSRERPLHNFISLFYPESYSELKKLRHLDFAEGQITLAFASGWSAQLLAGCMLYENFETNPNYIYHEKLLTNPFARLLVQYDRHFPLSFLDLGIYAQGGMASSSAPYSRMFDLGGCWGSPLLLNHSLITARPNEFTANIFCMVNLKLTTADPLVDFYNDLFQIGTSPRPFLLGNAAWGKMAESQNNNISWINFASPFQSPDRGIAEVGVGIDGLLVWGLVYWGIGAAYRLTPESASYHLSDTKDNLTFLLTAHIDI